MAREEAVAVANGKGGVGKTSVSSNLACLAASHGYRVLAVDMDPQGNLARDLGYERGDGSALLAALKGRTDLPVIKDVRENLDCVPGGKELAELPFMAFMWFTQSEPSLPERINEGLERLADDYDLIIFDTPPGAGERIVLEAVFEVVKHVIIPTDHDEGSLDGVERIAERFVSARGKNPHLTLDGVVVFGANTRRQRMERAVASKLESMLGGVAPVFEAQIREAKSVSVDGRNHGLLPHELRQAARVLKSERLKALRNGARGDDLPKQLYATEQQMEGLAGDYQRLTVEVLNKIAEVNANA